MSLRDDLLAVFEGRRPQVTPWFADLSYLWDSLKIRNRLDAKYHGDDGYVRFHKDHGVGCFLFLDGVWKVKYTGGVEHHCKVEGDIQTEYFISPLGELRGTWQYLPEAMCWAPLTHAVNSAADLDVVKYFCEHQKYVPDYDRISQLDALWGEQGIPIVFVNGSPLGTFIGRFAGPETTAFMRYDHTEQLHSTLEAIDACQDGLFETVVASPSRIVEFGENLSSELIGGYFQEYCSPWYKKRTQQLHNAGKFVSTHLDGRVGNLLPMLAETGIDCVEAVTPAPVGDLNIDEIFASAGDRLIIMGGVPGAMFSCPFTWREMEAHVSKVLAAGREFGRFILGTADAVPPDADVSFLRKISQLVHSHVACG
jgi:hypothetical protein